MSPIEEAVVFANTLTWRGAAVVAGATWALYVLSLVIYRLLLHPLRHVPGSRLAAATGWVETYYECFSAPGGQFMWKYRAWHEKYGPIVRISPDEVHIQDPTFYDTLFAQSRHSDKPKRLERRFNNWSSAFATAEHHIHRTRRAALNPYFSKKTIGEHSPHIQTHMDRLVKRVNDEFVGNGASLSLTNMWGAFASDIVVGYCLERPYDFILNPNFRAEFNDAMVDLVKPVHFFTQFPFLLRILQLLPDRLVVILSPMMRSVLAFKDQMTNQIVEAKSMHASGEKNPVSQGIFAALLDSGLPPEELETQRLQHEAGSVIGAGLETTTYALSTCSYHLLANPRVLGKLKTELAAAIPDPRSPPGLDALERLPYLSAVVNEALRFAYGVTQRLHRTCPTPVVYSSTFDKTDYEIPPGLVISMDNYAVAHDPWIYGPDPYDFRPERWEGEALAPDGKPLRNYLVPFGRGTRRCLGMYLAYADIFIGLASFFRRFDCELFETNRDAVDVYYDKFVPGPKPGTKGVRCKVVAGR